MMFGHVETIEERFEHLIKIREVQSQKPVTAKGFLAFIPWTFQDVDTLLAKIRGVHNLTTQEEYIRMIAMSRIMLPNIKNIQASWLNPRKVRDITVVAEQKMLTLDDTMPDQPIRIYDKGVVDDVVHRGVVDTVSRFRSIVHEGEIRIPPVSLGEPLRNECEHFIDCIVNGTKSRSGAREAIDVVCALEAASRSMRKGGGYEAVKVP